MGEGGGRPRGLQFLCFNGNLSRQFEFVQSNWALNPSFAGLSEDPDPLLAAKRKVPYEADSFTMQGCPVRRGDDVPRLVEGVGGGPPLLPRRAAPRLPRAAPRAPRVGRRPARAPRRTA